VTGSNAVSDTLESVDDVADPTNDAQNDSQHGDAQNDDAQDGARDAAGDGGGSSGGSVDTREDDGASAHLIQEGDVAADYLERFLDIVDYDGDIDLDVENDRAMVAIIGSGLTALIGPHGETLDALQELTRLAVAQKTGSRSRLMLDVSGHRQARRSQLTALATDTAQEVLAAGSAVRLAPMNPFERKVVHDAVAALDGVRSESEGEEPNRRVVVLLDR
jgi:spoIIIJ-associated protein